MPGIFRSASQGTDRRSVQRTQSATMRPPASVPYVVDNLWEWKRPANFPSRRFSVFASPNPKLALENGPPGGLACRISFLGRFTLCQLQGWRDSKIHPECRSLPKLLLRELGREWASTPLSQKQAVGRLWMPCLAAAEVEGLFTEVDELRRLRAKLEGAIHYWDSVVLVDDPVGLPSAEGELFFTAEEGYVLEELSEPDHAVSPTQGR
jgi:hypothetical protein